MRMRDWVPICRCIYETTDRLAPFRVQRNGSHLIKGKGTIKAVCLEIKHLAKRPHLL